MNSLQAPTWLDEVADQYEYMGRVGRGGFGEVHHIRHRQWNVEMAVKSPLIEDSGHRESEIRSKYFEREGKAWSDLVKHPNIVTCFYVRLVQGLPRIFMEYVGGGTLKRWIAKRWPPERQHQQAETLSVVLDKTALDIAIQICEGMSHVEPDMAHRDLKPANLLFGEEGEIRITDFGLAWRWFASDDLEEQSTSKAASDAPETYPFGSRLYRSPEHGTLASHDTRADTWSFAIILWEMMTGLKPRVGDHHDGIIARDFIAQEIERAPQSQVPAAVRELLMECVAPLEKRTKSFAELKRRVIQLYEDILDEAYPRFSPPTVDLQAADFNNRALSHLDLGDKEAAGRYWEQSLATDRVYLPAVFNYGLFRWRNGVATDKELVESLEMIAQDALSSDYVHFLLSQVHLVRGDPERAHTHLSNVNPESVSPSELHSTEGLIEFNQGHHAEAQQAFQRALEESSGSVMDYVGLGCSHQELGDDEGKDKIIKRLELELENGHLRLTHEMENLRHDPHGCNPVGHAIEATRPFRITHYADVQLPVTHATPLRFTPAGDRIIVGGKFRTTYGGVGEIQLASPFGFEVLGEFKESLWSVEFLSDGRVLFGDNGTDDGPPPIGRDGKLHLVDLRSWKTLKTFTDADQDAIRALAVSDDGRYAVSCDLRGTLARVWDLESGLCIVPLECEEKKRWHGVGFLPGPENIVVLWNGDGRLQRYEIGSGSISDAAIVTPPDRHGLPRKLETSRDGRRVLCAGELGQSTWRTIDTGELSGSTPIEWESCAVGRNDEWVLGRGRKGLALGSVRARMVVHTFDLDEDGYAWSFDLSPDLRWIVAACGRGLRIWRAQGLESTRLVPELLYQVSKPQPTGRSIESANTFQKQVRTAQDALANGQVHKAHDAARAGQQIPGFERHPDVMEVLHLLAAKGRRVGVRNGWKAWELTGHGMHVTSAAFHPNREVPYAVSSGWDGTFRIWNVDNGLPIYISPRLAAMVESVVLTSDARVLAGAGGALLEYDLVKGELTTLRPKGSAVWDSFASMMKDQATDSIAQSVWDAGESEVHWAFNHDGVFAARVGALGDLECWDTCKRKRLWQEMAPTRDWVALHPKDTLVLTGSEPMCLWDATDGTYLGEYRLTSIPTSQVCFSPDGWSLAAVAKDGSLALWDWKTARCVQRFQAKLSYPYSLVFSPDGKWLLTGSRNDVTLWSIGNEDPALRLRGHRGQIHSVDFSPDGRRAISGAWAAELFVWEFDWELDFFAS